MDDFALAVVVALSGWWFFTGVILWLVHQSEAHHGKVFITWTLLMPVALIGAIINAETLTPVTAVIGFTLALVIWGWLEMGYLIGWVTGPSSAPCPAGVSTLERMARGLGTCLYHELALLTLGALLALTTWDQPNPTALWAFSVLWVMRWSAKLNLVLGVRNYNRNWLPDHLEYLDSYIPRRRINPLFPLSLLGGFALTAGLFGAAGDAVGMTERISLVLVASLAALGTLEHLFLMMPLRDAVLWQWAAPREEKLDPAAALLRGGVSERAG